MSDQAAHYLRTEELYDEIMSLITDDALDDIGGETKVRGILDAILSQGKMEARTVALHQSGRTLLEIAQDPLIEQWQRIVDSA